MKIKRGDIYFADLDVGIGSEQAGVRPVIIVQNDVGNKKSGTVIVACVTSRIRSKTKIPTHYYIPEEAGLRKKSMALCEQLRTVDKSRLLNKVGSLTDDDLVHFNKRLAISLSLYNNDTPDHPYPIDKKKIRRKKRLAKKRAKDMRQNKDKYKYKGLEYQLSKMDVRSYGY